MGPDLHARMVAKLAEEGAGMIVFDILFHDENPEQDESFAAAMRDHGKVILAAEIIRNTTEGAEIDSLLLPKSNPPPRRRGLGPDLPAAGFGWRRPTDAGRHSHAIRRQAEPVGDR